MGNWNLRQRTRSSGQGVRCANFFQYTPLKTPKFHDDTIWVYWNVGCWYTEISDNIVWYYWKSQTLVYWNVARYTENLRLWYTEISHMVYWKSQTSVYWNVAWWYTENFGILNVAWLYTEQLWYTEILDDGILRYTEKSYIVKVYNYLVYWKSYIE